MHRVDRCRDLGLGQLPALHCDRWQHGEVARAVLAGDADVGATFAMFERGDASKRMVNSGFRQQIDDRGVHVIDALGPIPSDMIVAMPSVPVRVRSAIANAFTKLAREPVSSALISAK